MKCGLACALKELQVGPAQVVAVGDTENNHALLDSCGRGVAVATAIPALKGYADWIAQAFNGVGLVDRRFHPSWLLVDNAWS